MSPDGLYILCCVLLVNKMKPENIKFESPPLPPTDLTPAGLEYILYEYVKGIPINQWEDKAWPFAKNINKSSFPVLNEIVLREMYDVIIEKLAIEAGADKEKEIAEEFKTQKTKATYSLAKYLTHKYNIITIGEKEREMFVYKNGCYRLAENEIIYPEVQRILGEQTTKNAKTETLHKIADATSYPRDIFTSAPINLIPLKNGVYDTITKTLLSHNPEYRFRYQFPITYDPSATCPKTEAFMKQILTPDQMPVIEEWLGYYFYRLYSFKKALILAGEGNTGKTTLLETFIYLLGKENLSSISLNKMAGDKFAAAHLYGKHGNIVDELSAKDVSDTGSFKIATGGGSITGEYKFGNQFSFLNFSKLTFACNRIPDVSDSDDEAYFNRWMVLNFGNPIEKQIPNFIATLTTDEERSGLFNLAMKGLERLLKSGGFSYIKSAHETKTEMMKSGSSIAKFVTEMAEQEIGYEMSKATMYQAYADFCVSNNYAAEPIKTFGKKFSFYASYATDGLIQDVDNPKGSQVRGWRNVKLKTTSEEQNKDREFNEF